MRRTLTLSIAAVALVAGGTAIAQTQERGPMRGAEMTREAAEQRAAQMFARMDVNSDGQINSEDRQAQANARFDAVDTNSDGSISREEFAAMRENRRERMGERRQQRAEARPGAGQRMASGEGRRGPGMMGGRGGGMRGPQAMLGQADADNDGAISQVEFTNAMLARFDAEDTDGDGKVSREERRAAHPEGRRGQRAPNG